MNAEQQRLEASGDRTEHWKRWGPYLSERAWGTVREDYSADGTPWQYFPHEHARSRAYRWNEDGLAGICDRHQIICFAVALWNGHDPILKERAFGLTGLEGNHGEDVKEYYFYLDNTPTHSYMKYLYKYPQRAFPYADLVAESRRRDRLQPEYELLDTGAFADDRYFDVFVEYAKAIAEDSRAGSRSSTAGRTRRRSIVLPTVWFRNTWSWGRDTGEPVPRLSAGPRGHGSAIVELETASSDAACSPQRVSRVAVRRQRDQRVPPLRRPPRHVSPRTASTTSSSTAVPARSIRHARGPRRRRAITR